MPQPLEIKTKLQVLKPAADVFEAIVDPARMSGYFISKGSGRMEEGAALTWHFPEFEEGFPVRVGRVEPGRYISYSWDVDGREHLVEITLMPNGPGKTIVTAAEKGAVNDEAGLKWLKGNTAGWANFLDCLKAYLEYGINLRKGAFDYMKG